MEDTISILQILEAGGAVGTLLLFLVLFIRGDLWTANNVDALKKAHDENVQLIYKIAIDTAKTTGEEIGKKISQTILHDVDAMLSQRLKEFDKDEQ